MGLPDFHMLVVTVLKTCFLKKKPRELAYRNYKNFNSVLFNKDLKSMFSQDPVNSCDKFDKIFLEVLDKHAPKKSKILRANHYSYVSKALQKAIMKRSYLEKLHFKNNTENSLKTYKRQKTTEADFIKKKEKNTSITLINLSLKITKCFGKQYNRFFLIENDELIKNNDQVA